MKLFKLNAEVRQDLGKGASRRLRLTNDFVPGIIYGADKAPTPVMVDKPSLYKAVDDEAFYSSIITLNVAGKEEKVVIRDLQRHPFKPLLTHIDFLRIDLTQKLTMNVPLHITGQEACVGVKDQDGVLHVMATDIEISCLPTALPEYLELDVSALEVGHTLHLSDITLPEGSESVALSHGADHDSAVVNVTRPNIAAAEEDAAAGEGEEAAAE
ncbi:MULTISPECIES: 50S ribosomal protein L25/general stress protein Ctc [Cobetia]|uniref:Large ribosomal subunit protein bL25 n=1 Tax=Cobetia crustatorum TaxID=553385 RepID=A0A558HXW7_9GAMM|nr:MULTISPECIES: 50S ribosomal protein L25/general stress protein Ctc [Cobetia]TVU73967.1 50S ribosomal protein L25/general stress protein Ctc [Cobetia crustatorum]